MKHTEPPFTYKNKSFNPPYEDLKDVFGFIYEITMPDKRIYLGKKQFHRPITRPPLKGTKRKRKCIIESDWRGYWGSNDKIKEHIKENGTKGYKRKIILLVVGGKGALNYRELEIQIQKGVLLSDKYANGILSIKLNKSAVKGLKPL